ncbi:MAG: V-type ATP synthase subunit I [Lachnospiraceae bacterium]|jgi:V/A-type H+-transporting ATPase subunit I|nr:V-type ATP synthase subunit I [Lachnospiraceae bacterium]
MAVLQMQRISICALKKERKPILEKIQALGLMEMNQVDQEAAEYGFEKQDTMVMRQGFDKSVSVIENALSILDNYAPIKKGMFAALEGKPLVKDEDFNECVQTREKETLKAAEEILVESKKIAEYKANLVKLENQKEAIKPWLPLDVPMNYGGTLHTAMILGSLAGEQDEAGILSRLAEHDIDPEDLEINIIHSDMDATNIVVFCIRENETKIEDALRSIGFSRPSNMISEVPDVYLTNLNKTTSELEDKIQEAEGEIKVKSKYRQDLEYISDYYRLRSDKYQVLGTIPQSTRTFVISGYTTPDGARAIEKSLEKFEGCYVEVEELKEDEEPPVLLKNNKFSESVEGVLDSYGLPHKGEFDPTFIMSFFYVFFFGLMLSDAAYGAIMAIACFIVLKKFPRMSSSMHKNLKMFMFCGLSTVFWGVMFGGYFSDIVDVVSSKYLGMAAHPAHIPAVWFTPLEDPMKLLIFSMLFGLIHLFVGLGIKVYMDIKAKAISALITDFSWYALLIGLIMMLLPSGMFRSMSNMNFNFSPVAVTVSHILAIVGLIGLILFAAADTKNPVLRILLGLYEVYNITGWLSDVLSYSRLLALGLATGVIASVVNKMASMPSGVLGVIVLIIGGCFGHVFNMAINILGAYVHTNRLQFVEFFGKFYEGGGRAFAPFESNTKYVDIKEEN